MSARDPSAHTIAGHFEGKSTKKRLDEVTRLLETFEALGRANGTKDGWRGI
jgi:hypothetical protein